MTQNKWLKKSVLTAATMVFLLAGATSAFADIYESPNVNGYSTTNTFISPYNVNYGTTANNVIVDFWNFTNDSNDTHTITFWVDTPGAIGTFYLQDKTTGTTNLSPFMTFHNIQPGGQVFTVTLIPGHQYQLQVPPTGPRGYDYRFKIS
ncbi:hypothetical protein ACFOQM_16005 [Paenibacillus sp. GCM10012307]|uniref:Uncharacterized protein n=1 Tax=Paenibacillus roseus TaxID=2798579 RepID=A0A934J6Q2_9BACL|nr:hypothetical protein [Paenibacillus roseus]MBJ6362749.1 hypothetical protein [Paenibacillus roseus]